LQIDHLDLGAPVVTRRFLPSHAVRLGDALEVTIALRWRSRSLLAQHCCAARRHDHRRIRVTVGYIGVNADVAAGRLAFVAVLSGVQALLNPQPIRNAA